MPPDCAHVARKLGDSARDRRLDGQTVMSTSRLELTVVCQDRIDRAAAGEFDRCVQMDRIQRRNLDRIEPRGAIKGRSVDVSQLHVGEQAVRQRLQALAACETSQLDGEQRTRPRVS